MFPLVVVYALTWLVFRPALRPVEAAGPDGEGDRGPGRRPQHRALLVKSLVVTAAAVGLFFAGYPMATVALGAAAVLLIDRAKPEKAYRQVDWGCS